MINIQVNGISYEVPKNLTILQANEYIGNIIPHFCYHEKLLISGNCRMCLVEVEGALKPVAACHYEISKNMKIYTNTPLVQKIRENVLEFLLINHPLDCPICDQGGECDLQNHTMLYGSDRSRFFENKRGVSDKIFNLLIKSIMTRCIHCTRCVRFFNDICGTDILGTTGRGKFTEIGLYSTGIINSELSGNVIDLCPVGALTSKIYSFKARPWELRSIYSVDIFDSFCSPIEVSFKNNEIYRILPVKNFEINNIWISDRIRFSYDSFNIQRIEDPLIKKGNQFIKTNWFTAFEYIKKNIKQGYISGIFGESVDILTLYIFKKFINVLGSSNIFSNNKENSVDLLDNTFLNNTLEISNLTDLLLLVGIDSRFDFSTLNIKFKEISTQNYAFQSYSIGKPLNLTFNNTQLGWNLNIFIQICSGKHKISKSLYYSKNPLIILPSYLQNYLNIDYLNSILYNKIVFKFLNLNLSSINSTILGLTNLNTTKESLILRSSVLYFLESNIFKDIQNKFIIFQGYIGLESLKFSNVILPNLSFYEKNNIFLSNFGKLIETGKNNVFLKNIRLDSKIFIALLNFLNIYTLDNLYSIKNIKKSLFFNYPLKSLFFNINIKSKNLINNINIKLIEPNIKNFYLNNYILKSSLIMQKCSKTILIHKNSYIFYKNNN
jgi:NADH-quinone oxidoreductase chain G